MPRQSRHKARLLREHARCQAEVDAAGFDVAVCYPRPAALSHTGGIVYDDFLVLEANKLVPARSAADVCSSLAGMVRRRRRPLRCACLAAPAGD